MPKSIIFKLFTVLFIFTFSFLPGCTAESPDLSNSEMVEAPDFELSSLEGEKIKLSNYRGKLVFLNFWATWCPPCRSEMPDLQEFSNHIKNGDKAVFFALNIQESDQDVKSFMEENNLTLPVLMDYSGKVSDSYKIRSIPSTFVIDQDGKVIKRFVGMIGKDDLLKFLQ